MKKLLLHTCCAPCVAYVYQLLAPDYDITLYYYNPNIAPENEYLKRLNELEKFCIKNDISLIVGKWDNDMWTKAVAPYKEMGEGSQRCWTCYEYRLDEVFLMAQHDSFDIVATVMSISPHKNAARLNEIGNALSAKYKVEYLESDFKKKEGFKKSLEVSRENNFYRQDYCGCVYSKAESLERRRAKDKVKAVL